MHADNRKHTNSDNEKKTTLTLSLTVADKKKLKVMAAHQETSIAAIIHEWVQKYSKESN